MVLVIKIMILVLALVVLVDDDEFIEFLKFFLPLNLALRELKFLKRYIKFLAIFNSLNRSKRETKDDSRHLIQKERGGIHFKGGHLKFFQLLEIIAWFYTDGSYLVLSYFDDHFGNVNVIFKLAAMQNCNIELISSNKYIFRDILIKLINLFEPNLITSVEFLRKFG
jgi:hypothetical protein